MIMHVQQEEAMREDCKRREALKEEERQREVEQERIQEAKEVEMFCHTSCYNIIQHVM